jgi:transposase
MNERQYKQGIERQQSYLLPPSMEEYIGEDNPVRAIDSYVESLEMGTLGFKNTGGLITPGQPAYNPKGLLKLYLYGYLHRIRSSRRLEAECQRNLEVIWLLGGLRPGYKTIADFRKENLKGLKQVNQDFVQLCKELNLFGAELVGIDGSFFRGNVAKGSIFTKDRLKRSLAHLEKDITLYLEEMNQADQQGEGSPLTHDEELAQKLKALQDRQKKRQELLNQLEESGETQIAEVDADSRLLNKGGSTIAGYNVQTAVDAKHKLIVTHEVTQDASDEQQLAPMGLAAKAKLGVDKLETTQDKGYFNTQQIKECVNNGITPYVPEPDKLARARLQGRFTRDFFHYEKDINAYRCPAGQTLTYKSSHKDRSKRIVLNYQSPAKVCANCPLKKQCLPSKTAYRTIARWEHEEVIETHRARMANEGAEKMRERSGLCEHPFGTLKLWCGWTHFSLRGLEKVRAEMSLLVLCYNFKRVISILGLATFRAYCLIRRMNLPLVSE